MKKSILNKNHRKVNIRIISIREDLQTEVFYNVYPFKD